jgi:hypothetical protein
MATTVISIKKEPTCAGNGVHSLSEILYNGASATLDSQDPSYLHHTGYNILCVLMFLLDPVQV